MSDGSETEVAFLKATYALLFFGVPSEGMDVGALAAMVDAEPQRLTAEMLNRSTGFLQRHKQHDDFCKAFHFHTSRFIRFYELIASHTVRQDATTLRWTRDGDRVLLVLPASATRGRPIASDGRGIVSIQADHMGIVKFSPNDAVELPKVLSIISGLAEQAPAAVKSRLSEEYTQPALSSPGEISRQMASGNMQRQRRVRCDSCRRRKTKCDEIKPSCTACLRTGNICSYDESQQVPQNSIFSLDHVPRLDWYASPLTFPIAPSQPNRPIQRPRLGKDSRDAVENEQNEIYSSRSMSNESDPSRPSQLRRSPSISSITSQHSDISEHDSNGNLVRRTITTTKTTYYSTSASDGPGGPESEVNGFTRGRPDTASSPPHHSPDFGRRHSKSTNQRRFKCSFCDESFPRLSFLRTHVYFHTREKPFPCPVEGCGRRFFLEGYLRRHAKVHQHVESEADSEGSVDSDRTSEILSSCPSPNQIFPL